MSNRIETCGRCDSRIVEQAHSRERPITFIRYTGGEKRESAEITLCSMCLDDVWECVFDEDIDRSDKADPVPLDRLSEGVERHIGDLESVLNELEDMGARR